MSIEQFLELGTVLGRKEELGPKYAAGREAGPSKMSILHWVSRSWTFLPDSIACGLFEEHVSSNSLICCMTRTYACHGGT